MKKFKKKVILLDSTNRDIHTIFWINLYRVIFLDMYLYIKYKKIFNF